MAIRRVEDKDEKLLLEFKNGDREKFLSLIKSWNFKDDQSILRFMMSILGVSVDNTVALNKKDGIKLAQPSDEYLK